jgi:hypothetical protein
MKQVILLLFYALMVASCNKKKDEQNGYTCSQHFYRIGGYIGFVGYSLHDLDTICAAWYTRRSGFSKLQGRDTFVFNQLPQNTLAVKGDTVYLSGTSARQPQLTDTFDYRIFVPATGTEYSISGVGYVLYEEWHTPTPCWSLGLSVMSAKIPDSAWVDGQLTYGCPKDLQVKTIFLRKK